MRREEKTLAPTTTREPLRGVGRIILNDIDCLSRKQGTDGVDDATTRSGEAQGFGHHLFLHDGELLGRTV